jgi:hypothetical protein
MFTILRLLIGALRDCVMSRGRLEAEVIVLRHQLNMLRRLSPQRVRPNAFDRALFVCLYRYFPDIGNAVAIIRPETVIRWHRMGFRAWWRWKSRNPGGRPKIDRELRDLVRRMSEENPLWGAPPNPRRTAQAGLRCRAVDCFKIHAPGTKTAFARLEDISTQSRR